MKKLQELYRGKAKTLYASDDPDYLIMEFRDDATAFDGTKKASLAHKGEVNNAFNALVMQYLEKHSVPCHFVKKLSDTESLVKKLEMIPVECVIRNIVAGSLAKRLGLKEGEPLAQPVFEFFYKSDALHDPMINDSHILAFSWASADEIQQMREATYQVNALLKPLFMEVGILLVDFKLEFGRFQGKLRLGDEITPDGCRLWDAKTMEKLDKDRFRRDLGGVIEAYREVMQRIEAKLA
jgi:phosphoribosylaminoimidazole-succinocarboxamide synthase